MRRFLGLLIFGLAASVEATASAGSDFGPLETALERLGREEDFSGAVVIRGPDGVRFSAAYGLADPFSGARFRPETPVDSASLAKPMTAAAVLLLVQEGRIHLDAPVATYVTEFPHRETTVRQLLTHSAGLPGYDRLEPLAGKSNADLMAEIARRNLPPLFPPGSAFSYCNLCYDGLALLIERVTGRGYEEFLRERLDLPASAGLRPRALANWTGRAIGYRRSEGGVLERADSEEDEAFYGSANLSISAAALAEWGALWWSSLAGLSRPATAPVSIAGGTSGLTLGSWYCAPDRRRCHYIGHHQGFHHMLYWDADRRLSIAIVSNGSLAADLQPRLQRAVVAFASGRPDAGSAELARPLWNAVPDVGSYRTAAGELVLLGRGAGPILRLTRRGVTYDVYPLENGIGYAPGLDAYVTGSSPGVLRLLSLYEDQEAEPVR